MDTVLAKILDLIWKSGVGEKDFCLSIGINKSAVTDWKKGKTASYKKYIADIAAYFGVDESYFTNQTPSFFERFQQLSIESKSSVNAIARKIGLPSGSVTAWKNGAEPRVSAVEKIADHFDVSVDFLLGKTDNPKPPFVIDAEASTAEVLRQYYLYKVGHEPTQEELRELDSFADTFIKGMQKED